MDRGLKILKNAYWNKGWKSGKCTVEEFDIAKKEGYMFDYPKVSTHEEDFNELQKILKQITPEMVANAFLYSLSTRKLEYRSVLGSYWYAIAIPEHTCTDDKSCNFCGWYQWKQTPDNYDLLTGLNVLNFERYKWGGVRHTRMDYALFDLQQFLRLPVIQHTEEDETLLNEILQCVNELELHNKAGSLQKLITRKKLLKSNKAEVDNLLNILGICGLLSSDDEPCYAVSFCDLYYRSPPEHTNDYAYPLNYWKASDGINKVRYKEVFGKAFGNSSKNGYTD